MERIDLYELPIGTLEFRRACGGNQGGGDDTETCVTLAPIPGSPGAYALGDSKRPDREPLLFTADELSAAGIDPARFGLSV
ncbi:MULTISPECIES: DUF397 domain-containing protein [Kitasatospora]|uniref:Toxin-antitoxin system, toxin component n=1 Tax=Kitasatospora griseola TaxID=2064 RepID=A0A0D0PSG0_KITGR|nr:MULTISPECIES: DUF397 domain-containing protein [Kitasatospora]KIQ61553.1 toxin-antitoxin system, toxin component [Kitasatospora griseola]